MPATSAWPILQSDLETILEQEPNPIGALARGDVGAILIRQAFPAAECQSLVRFLIDEGLMYDTGDQRIDDRAIAADRVDRWTQHGLNPANSQRRRIDIGTSLGNYGDDQEDFLRRSAETHRLFKRLFDKRPNPVKLIYETLAALSPGKNVHTAREPDGREYGPAIFRIHYGGYTYGPHFDSVRLRESRAQYAVHRFQHQFAGVLCVQNATRNGATAQSIIHRQLWQPELDSLMKNGGFHPYAAQNSIDNIRVELEPGDLYFFNTGMIHEVPGVDGTLPRIVLATFIGYSPDDDEVMVWS